MIARAKTADPSASWTVDVHDRGRAVIVEDGDVWEKGCISVTLIEDGELTETRAAAISARTGSGIVARADIARLIGVALANPSVSSGLRFDFCSKPGPGTPDSGLVGVLERARYQW